MEVKKLRGDELKWDQQYEVNVTLDPDTINPQLILSEDGKQVHHGGVEDKLSNNLQKLTCKHLFSRGKSFTARRFYFGVQDKDKIIWRLALASE